VVLSTIGKFHTFDLARELYANGALAAIFTGYPRFKLQEERLPRDLIHCFYWVHAPYMGLPRRSLLGRRFNRWWEYVDKITLDRYVSIRMPTCDVFVGLSGSALLSGRTARSRGAKYVCDRGSSHIRVQDRLLREEHEIWGEPYFGIDPRTIEAEEAEYEEADLVTVPSTFSVESFIGTRVPAAKMRVLPYGVSIERFRQVTEPVDDEFNILFVGGMSLRKGIPYLLEAYLRLRHPGKSLTFAGTPDTRLIHLMKRRSLFPSDAILLGHVPQDRLIGLISRSHVLVLPSIEDGYGMVMAQALACGCPVIATDHTGAVDLFENGKEGFIVPFRNAERIAECLQRLADTPELRAQMSAAALARVRQIGGWQDYGAQALHTYVSLAA